jgi:Transposase, Mutator family
VLCAPCPIVAGARLYAAVLRPGMAEQRLLLVVEDDELTRSSWSTTSPPTPSAWPEPVGRGRACGRSRCASRPWWCSTWCSRTGVAWRCSTAGLRRAVVADRSRPARDRTERAGGRRRPGAELRAQRGRPSVQADALLAGARRRHRRTRRKTTTPSPRRRAQHRRLTAAARCLADDLDALFVHLRYPTRHRRRWRSTNLPERSLAKVKRRTKVIGRFPGETSCLTLVWTSTSPTPKTASASASSNANASARSDTPEADRPSRRR